MRRSRFKMTSNGYYSWWGYNFGLNLELTKKTSDEKKKKKLG
jgi:hypothetical protein